MKPQPNLLLTITSLLTILLLTFHLTGDITRGFEKGGLSILNAVPVIVLWLYAVLMLNERRSGLIINLLLSLVSFGIPIIHLRGRGVGVSTGIANSTGGFFFVWTLIAIAVTSLLSMVLSVDGLWRLRRSR